MGGRPVDLQAVGATDESVLGRKHVRGNLAGYLGFADGFEHLVTSRATPEESSEGLKFVGCDDLLQLIPEVIAFDENDWDGA